VYLLSVPNSLQDFRLDDVPFAARPDPRNLRQATHLGDRKLPSRWLKQHELDNLNESSLRALGVPPQPSEALQGLVLDAATFSFSPFFNNFRVLDAPGPGSALPSVQREREAASLSAADPVTPAGEPRGFRPRGVLVTTLLEHTQARKHRLLTPLDPDTRRP
jgi:hypothetical protein